MTARKEPPQPKPTGERPEGFWHTEHHQPKAQGASAGHDDVWSTEHHEPRGAGASKPSGEPYPRWETESHFEPGSKPSGDDTPSERRATKHARPVELVPLDLSRSDDEPPPKREWGVEGRFPRGHVALLSGEGGVGKSILLLQLAVAHVLGRDWLKSLPVEGPVLIVNCEDSGNELKRRLIPILAHYRARFADVAAFLHTFPLMDMLDDGTGRPGALTDTLLAVASRNGIMQPTPLYDALLAKARVVRPILTIIDNAADVFGGNEIVRSDVQQFVSLMRRIAVAANGYVILNAHPSVSGIANKSGLSGSTAWHNSVRSRAYLHSGQKSENGNGAPATSGTRVLEFMKSNYSALAERVELEWKNGLYLPVPTPTGPEAAAARAEAAELFLQLLDQRTRDGKNTSNNENASNYGPRVFEKTKEAQAAGIGSRAFADALSHLIEDNRICAEPYGPASDRTKRLARTTLL